MLTDELREKSTAELGEELLRLRREQFAMRMQRASEQLPQTHLIATTRRDIARVKTVLRERSIEGLGAAGAGAGEAPEPAGAEAAPASGSEDGEQSDDR